jgi:hypothetical protein
MLRPESTRPGKGLPGDGLLVEFRSVIAATRCAVAVQQGVTEQNTAASAKRRIEFPSASTRVTTSSTTMTFLATV